MTAATQDDGIMWHVLGAITAAVLLGIVIFPFNPFHPSPPLPSAYLKIETTDGHGSGVHIGNGYVLTAAHVASTGTVTITAPGFSGEATVLWANTQYDVALLTTGSHLSSVPIDCAANFVGQHVVAYGNPLDIDYVHTSGEVIGAARVTPNWKAVVPVDMTILPGQSGGAVVSDGHVVGIAVGVSAMVGVPLGIGHFVPAEAVCKLMGRV